MPEDFSILKYQFPPPGSRIVGHPAAFTESQFNSAFCENGYLSLLWEKDIPAATCFVIASIEIGIAHVNDPPRLTASKYLNFVRTSKAMLFYSLKEQSIQRAFTPPRLSMSDASRSITIAQPMPASMEAGNNSVPRVPTRVFTGPLVFGGERKIGIAFYCLDATTALGTDFALVLGAVHGWEISDPDNVWGDSFK